MEKSKSFSDFSKNVPSIESNFFCYAWGYGTKGQLGAYNRERRVFSNRINLLAFDASAGENHTAVITQNLKLCIFGDNQYGQLGIDGQPILYEPCIVPFLKERQITLVACGGDHTFAITSNQEIFSWGLNLKGQLGLGDYENRKIPCIVQSLLISNKNKKEAKKGFDFEKGLLNEDEKVEEISCGTLHSMVRTNQNRIFTVGYGETYALGHADPSTLSEFKIIEKFNFNTQIKKSFFANEISKICCGLTHSGCIVSGNIYLWGTLSPSENQIIKVPMLIDNNRHNGLNNVIDLKMGEMQTIALNEKGEVFYMNEKSERGFRKMDEIREEIGSIASGRNHVLCSSKDKSSVFGWGSNQYGQLNSGNEKFILNPIKLNQFKNSECFKIICGDFHSLAFSYKEPKFLDSFNKSTKEKDEMKKMMDDMETFKREREFHEKKLRFLNFENEKLRQDIKLLQKRQLIVAERKKLADNYSQTFDLSNDISNKENDEDPLNLTKKRSKSKSNLFSLDKPMPTPRNFTPQFEIDFNELTLEQKISEGGYGIIYRGRWKETTVAIKMLKIEGASESHVRDFLSECKAMEILRHPNIVLFIGACTKPPHLGLVLEYCSQGSLWSVLQNPDKNLTWEDRRKIALDTAKGIFYLHSFKPPILHRDLKSLNLLLDDSWRTKLIDFGWTRNLDVKMTGKIGTYQWMAPEVISNQNYTEKADVFSFGIILWEIASREPPYRNKSGLQVSIEVVNNDLRPPIPKKTPDGWIKLMKKCWDKDPYSRPSFKEIIKELESIKLI